MEEQVKKRMRPMIHIQQQLDDVPELIQRIQLALPSKDAALTCILSKSWLHAWSTSPAIRFCPTSLEKKQHQRKYMRWIHLTLLSYHRHNLPITSLDLRLPIYTTYRAARKLIMKATSSSKTSLKELRLTILVAVSFTLPDEIFLNENLHTLCLEVIDPTTTYCNDQILRISSDPAIQCTNLRVLELYRVHITQYVLNQLISKNKLLEKIILKVKNPRLNQILVKNLPYLREIIVSLSGGAFIGLFEIHHVPSLRSLLYDAVSLMPHRPPTLFQLCGTLGSLRELELDNVYMDDAFSNMIKSNFPFLEDLTLEIKLCDVEILDVTCLTLRRLKLTLLSCVDEEIIVQVYAPNLLTYNHTSSTAPSLLFTTTPPEQIDLSLDLDDISIDELFFLKIREALKLSSKFNIEMKSFTSGLSVPFNIDVVKTIIAYPATNVEELLLEDDSNDNVFGENSLLLDALFSICHPMYAKTNDELRLEVANYFLKLILKGVIENCEIRSPLDGRWVALTSSSSSLLDTTTTHGFYEFKLSWCSP